MCESLPQSLLSRSVDNKWTSRVSGRKLGVLLRFCCSSCTYFLSLQSLLPSSFLVNSCHQNNLLLLLKCFVCVSVLAPQLVNWANMGGGSVNFQVSGRITVAPVLACNGAYCQESAHRSAALSFIYKCTQTIPISYGHIWNNLGVETIAASSPMAIKLGPYKAEISCDWGHEGLNVGPFAQKASVLSHTAQPKWTETWSAPSLHHLLGERGASWHQLLGLGAWSLARLAQELEEGVGRWNGRGRQGMGGLVGSLVRGGHWRQGTAFRPDPNLQAQVAPIQPPSFSGSALGSPNWAT